MVDLNKKLNYKIFFFLIILNKNALNKKYLFKAINICTLEWVTNSFNKDILFRPFEL